MHRIINFKYTAHLPARLTNYIRLQKPCEHIVHNTRTFTATLNTRRASLSGEGAVLMQNIQHGHKKFVSVLLFIAGQVLRILPYQGQQSMQK